MATARWTPDLTAALATTVDGLPWRIWAWPAETTEIGVVRSLRQDLTGRRVVLATGRRMMLPANLAERLGDARFLDVVEPLPRGSGPPSGGGLEVYESPAPGGLRHIWSHEPADAAVDRHKPGDLAGWSLLATDDQSLGATELAGGFRGLRAAYRELSASVGTRPEWRTASAAMPPGLLLGWLALVLRRVVEARTGRPWEAVRTDLRRDGTGAQRKVFEACRVAGQRECRSPGEAGDHLGCPPCGEAGYGARCRCERC